MKLIIGLGNPGDEYTHTRHNLGFMVLGELAQKWSVHFHEQTKLKAQVLVTLFEGETVVLAKPQTFMNLSGNSVQKIKQFYKLSNDDIWIVSDDLDLDFGTIRVRQGGSSGGHNGLKSLIEQLDEDFVRIRVGIKNSSLEKIPTEKFVLQRFSTDEEQKLPDIITHSVNLIETSLVDTIGHTSTTI